MSTPFDNSWQAVLQPEKATQYFNVDFPPIELTSRTYNPGTALWMAELSRLIYRSDSPQANGDLRSRQEFLEPVHLQQIHSFSQQSIHCALIHSPAKDRPAFSVLVFRGSQQLQNWLFNLNLWPTRWPPGGIVHQGFTQALFAVWKEVDACLAEIPGPVFYTGHSLGAALATLAATLRPPHALYTFGSPQIGDKHFAECCQSIPAYRVVNHRDIVAQLPFSVATILDFRPVGELHYITHHQQMWINPSSEIVNSDRILDHLLQDNGYFKPAHFLSDHAPVNYVAHLERLLYD